MSVAVGIDLGTTYCCVGYLAPDSHVDIIDNEHGDRTTPSYVAFQNQKEIVGKPAKETTFRNPENVVYDSKRLIGRKFSDRYLQESLKTLTFKVSSDNDDSALIQISQQEKTISYYPHEVSAKLLAYMKKIAETRLRKKIVDAVITVPAYFNHHQRSATAKAAKLAGLNVLKLLNEPTAAVLAYIHKHRISNCGNILVFDLGGGTFDVSIVTVKGKSVTVRATSGNTHLGGRDFDNNLARFIMEQIKVHYSKDVSDRKNTVRRIYARSENLKVNLSFQDVAYLDLPSFLDGEDVDIKITKEDFERINVDLFMQCIRTVENCLQDAKMRKQDIENILLIGGSTRIPKLQQMLKSFFGGKKELIQAINPDEAVAYGAAVQAAMFTKGNKEEIIDEITDVTPLSLGIESLGSIMCVMIPRNTPIPVTKTTDRYTVVDKQRKVQFDIYEGERSLVKYNTKIGTCITDLPPKPLGYQVNIVFHINSNGILEVSTSNDTGIYKKLIITYEKPSIQTISDILQDAIINKAEDTRTEEVISSWVYLKRYCLKMQALCIYKTGDIKDHERCAVDDKTAEVLAWVDNNKIKNGNEKEMEDVLGKQKEIEALCEPILERCGYDVKNMHMSEFYELLAEK